MSMFGWFEKKHNLSFFENDEKPLIPQTFESFLKYFETDPLVNSVLNLIANKIAQISLKNNEKISELCMKNIVLNLFLTGNCFILKFNLNELEILPSESVSIVLNPAQTQIDHYLIRKNKSFHKINRLFLNEHKEEIKIPIENILQIKFLNPSNDLFGLSPLVPLRTTIKTHLDILDYILRFINNGGRPSGIFWAKYTASPTQKESIRREIGGVISHIGRKSSFGLIDGEISWQQLGAFPAEMRLLEILNSVEKTICHVLGVPPILFGIVDAKFDNYAEAWKYFEENTILLNLKIILKEINRFLSTNIEVK